MSHFNYSSLIKNYMRVYTVYIFLKEKRDINSINVDNKNFPSFSYCFVLWRSCARFISIVYPASDTFT